MTIPPAAFAEFNAGVERARADYARALPAPIKPVCVSCKRRTAHPSGQCIHCRRAKTPAAKPRRSTTTRGEA